MRERGGARGQVLWKIPEQYGLMDSRMQLGTIARDAAKSQGLSPHRLTPRHMVPFSISGMNNNAVRPSNKAMQKAMQ